MAKNFVKLQHELISRNLAICFYLSCVLFTFSDEVPSADSLNDLDQIEEQEEEAEGVAVKIDGLFAYFFIKSTVFLHFLQVSLFNSTDNAINEEDEDEDDEDDDDSDYEPFLGQLGRQNSKISTNCVPSTVSSGAIINEICDFVMEEYPR